MISVRISVISCQIKYWVFLKGNPFYYTIFIQMITLYLTNIHRSGQIFYGIILLLYYLQIKYNQYFLMIYRNYHSIQLQQVCISYLSLRIFLFIILISFHFIIPFYLINHTTHNSHPSSHSLHLLFLLLNNLSILHYLLFNHFASISYGMKLIQPTKKSNLSWIKSHDKFKPSLWRKLTYQHNKSFFY